MNTADRDTLIRIVRENGLLDVINELKRESDRVATMPRLYVLHGTREAHVAASRLFDGFIRTLATPEEPKA